MPLVPDGAELRAMRGTQEMLYERTRLLDESPLPDNAEHARAVRKVASMQRRLHELGRTLIEKLKQQQSPRVIPEGDTTP